jgi:hypothetical protein
LTWVATDEEINRAVLAVYEFFANPDVERKMVEQAYQRMPVNQADQIAAGARKLGKLPAWTLLGLIKAVADWDYDNSRACDHCPRDLTGPAHFAAWKPGLVVCAECTHLLGDAQRCDHCGKPDDSGLETCNIIVGSINYHVATCDDCQFAA